MCPPPFNSELFRPNMKILPRRAAWKRENITLKTLWETRFSRSRQSVTQRACKPSKLDAYWCIDRKYFQHLWREARPGWRWSLITGAKRKLGLREELVWWIIVAADEGTNIGLVMKYLGTSFGGFELIPITNAPIITQSSYVDRANHNKILSITQ